MATKPKKLSLKLPVDQRTSDMSDEALYCRRWGHRWEIKAISRKRFLELLALGQQESQRYCSNGCGSTWTELWDVYTGDVLETRRDYPKGRDYLMPTGSGRLNRSQARVAQFAREYSSYA